MYETCDSPRSPRRRIVRRLCGLCQGRHDDLCDDSGPDGPTQSRSPDPPVRDGHGAYRGSRRNGERGRDEDGHVQSRGRCREIMDIHLYVHDAKDERVLAKLDLILAQLMVVLNKETAMANELDALTAEVAADTTV